MSETWRIERRGGYGARTWWVLASGDEWTLRFMFRVLKRVIHRGHLRLIRPPGEVVDTFVGKRARQHEKPEDTDV